MTALNPRHDGERPENNPDLFVAPLVARRVITGGSARVYLCEGAEGFPGGRVVVKRLMVTDAPPRRNQQLAREAYLWLQLGRHANIVQLYGVTWALAAPTLLLEFAPESLRDRLATNRRLDVEEAVLLTAAVLRALRHADSLLPGFWHGDLKPENIMISDSGVYKVTDFGLASALTSRSEITWPHFAGTPAYAAPEVTGHLARTSASDMYAVGSVLFEMLSGEPLVGWRTGGETMPQLRRERLLRRFRRGAPAALLTLLQQCLKYRPEQRPSIEDALRSIERIAGRMRLLLPAEKSKPPEVRDLLTAAKGLSELGAFEDARALLRRVEGTTPADLTKREHVEIAATRAMIACETHNWGDAEDALSTAEGLMSGEAVEAVAMHWQEHAHVRANILSLPAVWLQNAKRNPAEALPLLTEAERLDPALERRINLARCLMYTDEWERGLSILEDCIGFTSRLDLHQLFVELCAERDITRLGLAGGRRAVFFHPTSGVAHSLVCLMLKQGGLNSSEDVIEFARSSAIALRDPHVHPTTLIAIRGGLEYILTHSNQADDVLDRHEAELDADGLVRAVRYQLLALEHRLGTGSSDDRPR